MVRLNSRKMYLTYRAILTLTPETHKGAGLNGVTKLMIADPIFIDFYIDRSIGSTINTSVIKFFNLNQNTSSLINQERFTYVADAVDEMGRLHPSEIELYAFYLGKDVTANEIMRFTQPIQFADPDEDAETIIRRSGIEVGDLEENLIFKGVITEANTYRQSGATDVVTEIFADDRFLEMGLIKTMLATGQDKRSTIIQLAQQGGYKEINIGEFNGTLLNNWVVNYEAFVAINKITGGLAFIDCGVLNVLNNNETLADRFALLELTNESGLLGTPRRTWGQLIGEVLFAPEIRLAMRVRITSRIDSRWDGTYKVLGLTHRGRIGPGGPNFATTTVTVIAGPLAQASSIILTGAQPAVPNLAKYVKKEQIMAAPVSGKTAYDVLQYIKQYRRAPQWYITSEVTWANAILEENLRDGSLPAIAELQRLSDTCRIVQGIKNRYYPGGRLSVRSGWRSRRNNTNQKGSAKNSQHLYGRAVDFRIEGYDSRQVFKLLTGYTWRTGGTANDGRNTSLVAGWTYYMEDNGNIHYDTMRRRGINQIPVQGWSDY